MTRLWGHISLSVRRKLGIVQSVITSRLLYGLSSAWLNVARELRQLDGFKARCLRRILGVRASFYSRVSNHKVLEQSGHVQYSRQLLKHQLLLFGKVARKTNDDPLRKLTFCEGSLSPATSRFIRRVGRPRHEWAGQLLQVAFKVVGDRRLEEVVYSEESWTSIVNKYIKA